MSTLQTLLTMPNYLNAIRFIKDVLNTYDTSIIDDANSCVNVLTEVYITIASNIESNHGTVDRGLYEANEAIKEHLINEQCNLITLLKG